MIYLLARQENILAGSRVPGGYYAVFFGVLPGDPTGTVYHMIDRFREIVCAIPPNLSKVRRHYIRNNLFLTIYSQRLQELWGQPSATPPTPPTHRGGTEHQSGPVGRAIRTGRADSMVGRAGFTGSGGST